MIDAPDLRVINLAIKLIASGKQHYTCLALIDAARHYNSPVENLYSNQYRRFVFNDDNDCDWPPIWWNSISQHKTERIQALKAFKQACINAGKKQAIKG